MMLLTLDWKNLVHPPEEVGAFVDRLIQQMRDEGLYYSGPDRRGEKRHPVALPIRVLPLDDELRAEGAAFAATTKDISRRGIAFVHFEHIKCPYLAVELSDEDGRKFKAAVEVLRCRPVGPYFEVAGRFVTKVYDPIAGQR